jgi:hypothetical protein
MLSACGGTAAPPAATVAPPPTNTPAPTNTPVPTAIPTPKPISNPKEALTAAFAQVKAAKAYEIAISFKAKGALGQGAPTTDPNQEIELLAMKGAISGKNSQISLGGVLAGFLGATDNKAVEFITLDGKNYIKGPVPMLNAPEDKWYELPAGESSPTSGFSSDQLLGSVENDKLDLSTFTVAGTEKLDGKQCTILKGDKAAIEAAFKDSQNGLPTGSFKEFSNADLQLWVCEDGYFRKMALEMEGIPEGQTEKATIKIEFLLTNFDGDISIKAPADAIPLPVPTPTN